MPTFWLSFATRTPPARVCLIDALSFPAAHRKAHELGLNVPGSEVLGFEIPPDALEFALPRDRHLTAQELASVGAGTLGNLNPDVS